MGGTLAARRSDVSSHKTCSLMAMTSMAQSLSAAALRSAWAGEASCSFAPPLAPPPRGPFGPRSCASQRWQPRSQTYVIHEHTPATQAPCAHTRQRTRQR